MANLKPFGCILGGLVLGGIAFVVFLFLVKLAWAWTIPDLFPRAVKEGYVAGTIKWFTAVKLALFIAVLSGFTGGAHASRQNK